MKLFTQTPKIPFLNFYKYAFSISTIFIIIGLIFIFINGIKTSIDFTGGTIVNVAVNQDEINIADLRTHANDDLKSNVNIVLAESTDSSKSLMITMDFLDDEKILNQFLGNFFADNYEIIQVESIGPKLGNELRVNARNAILAEILIVSKNVLNLAKCWGLMKLT